MAANSAKTPGTGRAREACGACRGSRKKCAYTEDATGCDRCKKRGSPCSLFPSPTAQEPASNPSVPLAPAVDTQCAQPMLPAFAPDSTGTTPDDSAPASSICSVQEHHYPDFLFDQHPEQPDMNLSGFYCGEDST